MAGGPINRDNADFAVVLVTFPDGTTCRMEHRVRNASVKYRLDLRERDGQLEEKRGTCTPPSVPSVSGGTVTVVHDDDDDPTTANTPLLSRTF
jgi:hypothetical protein